MVAEIAAAIAVALACLKKFLVVAEMCALQAELQKLCYFADAVTGPVARAVVVLEGSCGGCGGQGNKDAGEE